MSNRAVYVAVPVLAGVGYYMYNAGGDPKAAQKRLEGMSKVPSLPSTTVTTTINRTPSSL